MWNFIKQYKTQFFILLPLFTLVFVSIFVFNERNKELSGGETKLTNKEKILNELKDKDIVKHDERTITWKNSDGTYTMRVYQEDMNTEYVKTSETTSEKVLKGMLGDTVNGTNNADTALKQAFPDTNYGTDTAIAQNADTGVKQNIIMSWTLPASPGAGATISKITVNLLQYNTSGLLNSDVHALTRTDWTSTGATWNSYKSGSTWTTAGGDYSATIIDTAALTKSPEAWAQWVIQGTGATNPLSLTWSNDTHLLFKAAVGESGGAGFRSKEYSSNRPYMEITYSIVAPASSIQYNSINFSNGE